MEASSRPSTAGDGQWIETDVPARMDRLPWSSLALVDRDGARCMTWILDGLEVTLAGALGVTLKNSARPRV